MNITLATHGFANPGGSETYILTVAEQLQRLGHGVIIAAEETGPMTDFASDRGLEVTTRLTDLEDRCDVLLVQDSIMSYRLADRYRGTPQVFRAASDLYDLQLPPALPGLVSTIVVCSERVRRRVRHLAASHTVHRLRQPIDTERFAPAGAAATSPRRAVLLGNYLSGRRLEMIETALARRGISCEQVGARGTSTCSPEQAIWPADIVIAKGRAALEGMACGKPVFVYDHFGGDGWVTAERYPAMEADNFAGQSRGPLSTLPLLEQELDGYSPDMGLVNRELATTYHGARAHAHDLCELLPGPGVAPEPDRAPLLELARLVDVQWRTELRALVLERASSEARRDAELARSELHALRTAHAAETEALVGELERARAGHANEVSALTAELERLRALTRTRRVRFGVRLGRIADSARRSRSPR